MFVHSGNDIVCCLCASVASNIEHIVIKSSQHSIPVSCSYKLFSADELACYISYITAI